jgi:hypothetical protein
MILWLIDTAMIGAGFQDGAGGEGTAGLVLKK